MDSQGFPRVFYDDPDVKKGMEKDGSIREYSVSGDFVHILLFPLVGAKYYFCHGFGQESYVENHSPNTFFAVHQGEDGKYYLTHDCEDGNLIAFEDESQAMQKLQGFTIFAYNYMSEEERAMMADYLGEAAIIALSAEDAPPHVVNGVAYSKSDLVKYLFSDPETLSLLIAYLMVYANEYGLEWDDIEVFLPRDLKLETMGMKLGGRLLFFLAKDSFKKGRFGSAFWTLWHKTCEMLGLCIDQNQIDKVWKDALIIYPELVKYSNSFFPGTSYAKPSESSGQEEQYSGSATLFIDNEIYKCSANNIYETASCLTFNQSIFDMDNEVCGTESMITLTQYWHQTAEVTESNRRFNVGPVYKSLLNVQTAVDLTNQNVADALESD